jgi:hypothetical protein
MTKKICEQNQAHRRAVLALMLSGNFVHGQLCCFIAAIRLR